MQLLNCIVVAGILKILGTTWLIMEKYVSSVIAAFLSIPEFMK